MGKNKIRFSLNITDKKRQYPTKKDNQNEVIEANFAPQSGQPKSQRKLIFSIQEKDSILRGKMWTGEWINLAQNLLVQQFPWISELLDTSLGNMIPEYKPYIW